MNVLRATAHIPIDGDSWNCQRQSISIPESDNIEDRKKAARTIINETYDNVDDITFLWIHKNE